MLLSCNKTGYGPAISDYEETVFEVMLRSYLQLSFLLMVYPLA